MKRHHALFVALLSLAAAACGTADPSADTSIPSRPAPAGDRTAPAGETPTITFEIDSAEIEALDPGAGDAGGVCSCTTQACVDAWVSEHIGCPVCVVFRCEGGDRTSCVQCPAEDPTRDDGSETAPESPPDPFSDTSWDPARSA